VIMTDYKVFKGVQVKVLSGTTNVGKTFEVSTNDPIIPGTTNVEFTDVSCAGATHDHDEAYAGATHDHSALYSPVAHNHDSVYPLVLGGTTAPSEAPAKPGNIYIDSVTKDVYVAAGATSASDWIKVN
jgi:hypothetical protein